LSRRGGELTESIDAANSRGQAPAFAICRDVRGSRKVRYDKLRSNFRGFVKLAVTAIWLKPLIHHHSLATVVGLVRGRERRIRSRRHQKEIFRKLFDAGGD
jgi:hypothetical protein